MDNISQYLNFTNSDGSVITVFGGAMTLSQLLGIIAAIVVISIALKFIKGILKAIITVLAICFALVYFNLATPEQIADTVKSTIEQTQETLEKTTNATKETINKQNSENIGN